MEIVSIKINKSRGVKIEAKEGEKILGWAYLYVMYNDLHKEPFGFMENVFVQEEYRGKGLGTQLVQKVIEEARRQGCYKLVGTSRYGNPVVHALYEKIGFKDHGKEFRIDL